MVIESGCWCILGGDARVGLWWTWGTGLGRYDRADGEEEEYRGAHGLLDLLCRWFMREQWSVLGTASLLQFIQYGCLFTALYRLSSPRYVPSKVTQTHLLIVPVTESSSLPISQHIGLHRS